MIYNNDDRLREWYNDEAPINKVMGAGSVIFQRLHDSNPHKNIVYRWVVVEDDYICQSTTKYEKLKEQISDDYGATWNDVYPPMYKKGNVIEYDSPDCGYVPPQYRWIALDPSVEYICSGTSKYVKEVREVSWDEGETWERVVPEESRMGELVETDCRDCGYRTRTTSGSQYCNGDDLYVNVYSQVSTDGGRTWTTTATTSTLVQAESPTCMCYNPSSYAKTKKAYFTYHYGSSPVVERYGYINCSSSNTTLNGSDIDNVVGPVYEHFGYDALYVGNCVEIVKGLPSGTKVAIGDNNIIREVRNSFNGSAFCEGVFPSLPHVELIHDSFTKSNITSIDLPNTLTAIDNSFERVSGITEVTIPDSVQTIGSNSFNGCANLSAITIGSGCTIIGYETFMQCKKLRYVTITAVTPPVLGQYCFEGDTKLIFIYVPDESVGLYQTSGRWANFASKIKPISTKP